MRLFFGGLMGCCLAWWLVCLVRLCASDLAWMDSVEWKRMHSWHLHRGHCVQRLGPHSLSLTAVLVCSGGLLATLSGRPLSAILSGCLACLLFRWWRRCGGLQSCGGREAGCKVFVLQGHSL